MSSYPEKGRDMEADGGQTQKRRRKTNYLNPESPEPKLQIYPDRERAERITTARHTDGFDEGYSDPPRPKSSTVRMSPPISSASQVMQTYPTTSIPKRQQALTTRQLAPRAAPKSPPPLEKGFPKPSLFVQLKQMHWLFLIGLGMICALVLWLIGSAVLAWGTQRYYDVRYGTPRTFQTDMAVGHGGDSAAHPSHFIAMNLNNQAVVIELKAGKADNASVAWYIAPITIMDGGQSPVTISFRDVSGDHKPDMIIDIHLLGQDQYSIFINDGDKFRPATSNDTINT
jgi:hypothetical protein